MRDNFPFDMNALSMSGVYFSGRDLYVVPTTQKLKQTNTESVYFPLELESISQSTLVRSEWYNYFTHQHYCDVDVAEVNVPEHRSIVFRRAGSVIAAQNRIRKSTSAMLADPYVLEVAVHSRTKSASGVLYLDDGISFDFQDGKYAYRSFSLSQNPNILGDVLFTFSSKKGRFPLVHRSESDSQLVLAMNIIEYVAIIGYQHLLDSIVAGNEKIQNEKDISLELQHPDLHTIIPTTTLVVVNFKSIQHDESSDSNMSAVRQEKAMKLGFLSATIQYQSCVARHSENDTFATCEQRKSPVRMVLKNKQLLILTPGPTISNDFLIQVHYSPLINE